MKRLFLSVLLGVAVYAQTGPPGYVGPVAPVGATASGWKYLQTDGNGKLYLASSPASSSQGGPSGYVGPVALVGQSPTGNWLYLQTDANGNLLTSGGGGGSMTWPTTPGITVCTSTPCTAWGTSLTAPTGALVGTGQANTYTTGLQDFSAATVKLPTGAAVNSGTALGDFLVSAAVSTTPRGIVSGQWSTDTASARLNGYKARGTQASPTTVATGDFITRWSGFAYDGSNYLESSSIVGSVQGTVASTRTPGQIDFYTMTDAAPSVLTLAMTINKAQIVNLVNAPTIGGSAFTLPWSSLTNPTGNLSLSMGANTSTFTSGATTGSGVNMHVWTDTASNTGTGAIGRFTTASGSAAYPWQADANGVGFEVNSAGNLVSVSTANLGIGGAPVSSLSVLRAPVTTANYGSVSIGSGPFDGSTTGKFVGSSNGTQIAVNSASGSTADLMNLQVAGGSKFKVDASGGLTSVNYTLNGSGFLSFTGSGTSTLLPNQIAFTSSATGTGQQLDILRLLPTYTQASATNVMNTDFLINRTETNLGTTPGTQLFTDFQVAGVSKWNVDHTGFMTIAASTFSLGGHTCSIVSTVLTCP